MKMKKILSGFMATAITIASMNMPVFADNTEHTDAGTQVVPISASIPSSFSVSVPAALALTDANSDGIYTGAYQVGAKGAIGNHEGIYVKPQTQMNYDDDAWFSIPIMGGGETLSAKLKQDHLLWANYDNDTICAHINKNTYTYADATVDLELADRVGMYNGSVTYEFGKSFFVPDEHWVYNKDENNYDKTSFLGSEVLQIIKSNSGKKYFEINVFNGDEEDWKRQCYNNCGAFNGISLLSPDTFKTDNADVNFDPLYRIDSSTQTARITAAETPGNPNYIDPSATYILAATYTGDTEIVDRMVFPSIQTDGADSAVICVTFVEKEYGKSQGWFL